MDLSITYGKAHGSDSGTTAHIERFIIPEERRIQLARILTENSSTIPDGVKDRTAAIQHRLENAGLTRKIGNNWTGNPHHRAGKRTRTWSVSV